MTEQQKTSVYKDLVIVVLVLVLIGVVWKQGKNEHAYQASEERQNRLYEQVALLRLDSMVNANIQDSLSEEIDSLQTAKTLIQIRYVTKIRNIHHYSAGYIDSLLSARYDILYPRFIKATTE